MNIKRTLRLLTALVCVLLALTLGSIPILGASVFQNNLTKQSEVFYAISLHHADYVQKANEHTELSKEESNVLKDRVWKQLSQYQTMLSSTFGQSAMETEDLSDEFDLMLAQAKAAADATWIAYVHGVMVEANGTADPVFLTLYGDGTSAHPGILSEIAGYSIQGDKITVGFHYDDPTQVSNMLTYLQNPNNTNALCIKMNQCVFEQKINKLPAEIGVEEALVANILKNGKLEVSRTYDPNIDGQAYQTIYENVRGQVILEKFRHAAKKELQQICLAVGMTDETAMSEYQTQLNDYMKFDFSLEEINQSLSDVALEIIRKTLGIPAGEEALDPAQTSAPATVAYYQRIVSAFSLAVENATDSVPDLSRYLDGSDATVSSVSFLQQTPSLFSQDNQAFREKTSAKLQAALGEADACAALRQETLKTCLQLLEQIPLLSLSPTEYQQQAQEQLDRALAADTVLDRYHKILSSEKYPHYDSESVNLLAQKVETGLNAITFASATPSQVLEAKDNTLLDLERIFAIAEIRLAGKDSDLENVKKCIAQAEQSIADAPDTASIHSVLDDALFRIGAYRTAESMRDELTALEIEIDALRALTDTEKETLKSSATMQALRSACDNADNANDQTQLDAIVAAFAQDKQTLRDTAMAQSLQAGIQRALTDMQSMVAGAQQTVASYQYISDDNRARSEQALKNLLETFSQQAPNVSSFEELDALTENATQSVNAILAQAFDDNNDACKQSVYNAWLAEFDKPDHYSKANYEQISALLSASQERLEQANSIEAILALRDEIQEQLRAVPTLLDEAKTDALSRLQETYDRLMKNKTCYAEENLLQITETYDRSVSQIQNLKTLQDIDRAASIATEHCALMENIRMDRVYTNGMVTLENDPAPTEYPPVYDIHQWGYWGFLSAPGTVPASSRFTAMPFDTPKEISSALSIAIRQENVIRSNGVKLESEVLKTLRGCTVLIGMDLSYSAAQSSNGRYQISLLLPNDVETAAVLGVVYVTDDGYVEYFDCSVSGQQITFETSHFSNFYILSEKPLNLIPLIITLSALLVLELIAIVALLIRRSSYQRRKEQEEPSIFSENPSATLSALLPVFSLRRILPVGGIPIVIILAICVLAATIILAWLITEEWERRKQERTENETENAFESNDKPLTALEPQEESEPMSEPIAEPEPEPEQESLTEPEPIVPITAPEPLPLFRPIGKKAIVNLDTISEHYTTYEDVSLATLKEKGLIPRRAGSVKILARGTLALPLTVKADAFSAYAKAKILQTGGEAITEERT